MQSEYAETDIRGYLKQNLKALVHNDDKWVFFCFTTPSLLRFEKYTRGGFCFSVVTKIELLASVRWVENWTIPVQVLVWRGGMKCIVPTLSLTLFLSLSLSLSHTHTHTHLLFPSFMSVLPSLSCSVSFFPIVTSVFLSHARSLSVCLSVCVIAQPFFLSPLYSSCARPPKPNLLCEPIARLWK
jgi:hypothetical protein